MRRDSLITAVQYSSLPSFSNVGGPSPMTRSTSSTTRRSMSPCCARRVKRQVMAVEVESCPARRLW